MSRRPLPQDQPDGLTHNPFAALRGEGSSPLVEPSEDTVVEPTPKSDGGGRRLVIRREKRGRGGKTVTRIAGLAPTELQPLAVRLKRALGCGATIDGPDILLQGSQLDRAATWLESHLGTTVTRGN